VHYTIQGVHYKNKKNINKQKENQVALGAEATPHPYPFTFGLYLINMLKNKMNFGISLASYYDNQ